jgi:23S rRNA (uracil1939-C5)-methyltransferase
MHIDECLLLPKFARKLPGRVRKMCTDLIGDYRGRFALRLPFVIDHVGGRVMLVPGRSPMRKVRRMMGVVLDELESAFPVVKKLQRIISGRDFNFNPLSFTQANETLMPKLYEKARSAVAGKRRGKILDLYSGVGVLGIICAGEGGVTFVEQTPSAVEDIERNVMSNRVMDATIFEGDVDKLIDDILREDDFGWVLMNPPRKGITKHVAETLAGCKVNNIVYVSCNPATLGRDVGRLREGGFEVVSAQGVDMFPRTPHVESVVVLSR